MPDNYAHRHMALAAVQNREYQIPNEAVFIWGANGPDPLFYYEPHKKQGKTIREFGGYMHNVKTGLFLKNLYSFADTDVKKSYFLGFLCHYGADTTMHPLVDHYTTHGGEYDIKEGHGFFEAALDCYIAQKDGNGSQRFVKLYAPKLSKEELREISELFQQAVSQTYDVAIPLKTVEKVFCDFRSVSKFLNGNQKIFSALECIMQMDKGKITSHIQPAVMELHTQETWYNHFTKQEIHKTLDEMIGEAIEKCEVLLSYGMKLLQHPECISNFEEEVGNLHYGTGLELEKTE